MLNKESSQHDIIALIHVEKSNLAQGAKDGCHLVVQGGDERNDRFSGGARAQTHAPHIARQMYIAHMYNARWPGLRYLRRGPAQTAVGWTLVKGMRWAPSRAEVGRILASAVRTEAPHP